MEWYEEKKFVLRLPGLEPGSNRWQRSILPLNHKRVPKFLYTIQVLNIPKLSNNTKFKFLHLT